MLKRLPPFWIFPVSAVIVYGGGSALAVRLLRLPETFAAPAWLSYGVGGTLIVLGVALIGWSLRHLSLRRAAGREVFAKAEKSTLVTSGPYAIVRNPIYIGVSTALLGWTLLLRATVLALATLLMLGHFAFVARWEAREMGARMGERYEAYRRATPAFLPRLRRRR